MRVQGQSHGTGDGDGAGDGLRSQATAGARDGVGVQPQPAGAQPTPPDLPKRSGVQPVPSGGSPKPATPREAPEVRDGDGALGAGELTGPLPVVAPTGRRNGRTRAAQTPAEVTQMNPLRRTRVIVRRLGPLSVFRFTLLYSFSVMLVLYLALVILYTVLGALGLLDSLGKTMVSFGVVNKGFHFNGGWIFSRLFLLGVVLVLLWSLIKVIASLVYNLVSNIVGGIEVTLAERR
ncbi:MAG: DUF3566 domain-containing protein [Actinomycetota bacterium]